MITSGTKSPTPDRSKSNTPKFKHLPVRSCDMDLTVFGIPSTKKTDSARKPKYAIPVRTCDMDLNLFEHAPIVKKNPVRKQLWSAEKRNTNHTSNLKPNKNNRKSTAIKSLADSHRKTFTSVQESGAKQKEAKLVKKLKIKSPKIQTAIPLIVLHEPEKNSKEDITSDELKFNEKFNSSAFKTELKWEQMLSKLELKFNDKINNLERKIDDMSTKLEQGINYKCINCGCNSVSKSEVEIDRKKYEDKCSLSRTAEEELNRAYNIVENLQNAENCNATPSKSDNDQSFITNSTPEVNDLIDKALSSIETNENKSSLETEIKNVDTLVLSDSPVIHNENNLLALTKKFVNKFEILESKLINGSPMSNEFSLSDNDSPAVIRKDINWLINDKNDFKSPLCKSLSASSIESHKKKKKVTFQTKSQTDLYSDSVSNYNEMRNNVHFLCTPKNTRIAANLMTPSVQNNQTKMLSRRIQEQCLLLE